MKNAHRPHRTALLAAAVALALLPALAPAQAIYRIVGPDGRVTFSDKPPATSEKATALSPSGRSAQAAGAAELPFELREAMSRYPVTLYTGDNCPPCAEARNLLSRRGIPYIERTISTTQDIEAYERLGLETIPAASIGGQRLKGYSESAWSDYLDAAGYPKTSRLPSTYRNTPASPLAPIAEAAPPSRPAAATTESAPASPPPPGPTPSNPTGIVF